jgi:hypothetical protein
MSNTLEEHLQDFQTWLQDADFELDPDTGKVWNGSISVEWMNSDTGQSIISEHKVSILLPPGFPYRAPTVASRDEPPLAPSWHLAPGLPHTLCLWDSETGWRPHFTAQFLLSTTTALYKTAHLMDNGGNTKPLEG